MHSYEEGRLRLLRVGPLGPFANNAYIVADEETKEAVIIDMPEGSERVLEAARDLRVKAILLTHTHPDHTAAYDLVKQATGAPVYCHAGEMMLPVDKMDQHLEEGQQIRVGDFSLRVIYTPGHTPGSACFYVNTGDPNDRKYLLSGDTLFPGGPGHSKSPEALIELIRSITGALYTLPDETVVLPGHGESTTIGESKREYEGFASRPHRDGLCGDVLWKSS